MREHKTQVLSAGDSLDKKIAISIHFQSRLLCEAENLSGAGREQHIRPSQSILVLMGQSVGSHPPVARTFSLGLTLGLDHYPEAKTFLMRVGRQTAHSVFAN